MESPVIKERKARLQQWLNQTQREQAPSLLKAACARCKKHKKHTSETPPCDRWAPENVYYDMERKRFWCRFWENNDERR